MKINAARLLPVLFLISLSACLSGPEVINHPRPDLSVDFEVFYDGGCSKDQYGLFTCAAGSPLYSFGCDEIRVADTLLGGLQPSDPIAACYIHWYNMDNSEFANGRFFYNTGGLASSFLRYIVHRNGEFLLIKSESEFRELYAPIESPEEALSFVLAVKNLTAYYDLEIVSKYEYEVDLIEDTRVTDGTDGYDLLLYSYQLFGCGPHWTSAVDMHVTADGVISETKREPVYRNPEEDDLCVD